MVSKTSKNPLSKTSEQNKPDLISANHCPDLEQAQTLEHEVQDRLQPLALEQAQTLDYESAQEVCAHLEQQPSSSQRLFDFASKFRLKINGKSHSLFNSVLLTEVVNRSDSFKEKFISLASDPDYTGLVTLWFKHGVCPPEQDLDVVEY